MTTRKAGTRDKEKEEDESKKEILGKKQSKIILEKDKENKKVTFEGVEGGGERRMREAIDNLRKEIRRELEELRESWKDKFNKIEEKVEEIENGMIEWKEEKKRNITIEMVGESRHRKLEDVKKEIWMKN